MNQEGFGGLYADVSAPPAAGSNVHVLSTGTELSGTILAWSNLTDSAKTHGEASVTPSTTTGRLTLKAGTYEVIFEASVENNVVSGLSSEDVTVQDILQAQLYQGNSSGTMTAISGSKATVTLLEGLPTQIKISTIFEMARAGVVAATAYNFISVWLSTAIVGGAATDVYIRNARFYAKRLK